MKPCFTASSVAVLTWSQSLWGLEWRDSISQCGDFIVDCLAGDGKSKPIGLEEAHDGGPNINTSRDGMLEGLEVKIDMRLDYFPPKHRCRYD